MKGTGARWRFWTPPEGSIPTLPIPSIEGVRSVHLVGIGGAGMRNLARLFVARGLTVSGSDLKDSASLTELGSLGVRVHIGHDPALLGSPDVVVVSSAIRDDDPEVTSIIELERMIKGVDRLSMQAKFASKFRSSTKPLPPGYTPSRKWFQPRESRARWRPAEQ